jgi:hypothetical protein
MARLPRQRNTRVVRAWPGMDQSDNPDPSVNAVTVNSTTYSLPMYGCEAWGTWSFQLIVGVGLTATFSLQASMVPCPELTNDNDWVTIASPTVNGTALAYSGTAGNSIISPPTSVVILPEWIRIKCTFTSGSGTVALFYRGGDSH